jgi:hypothetical protein
MSQRRRDGERHPGFHRRERPVRAAKPSGGGRRGDVVRPPAQGPINIFLDDEREAPDGFVAARSLPAFERLLDTVDMPRVRTICLDWHLGINAEPGQSGHDAVRMLLDRIEADPTRFVGLSSVWLHSTEIPEAVKMARAIEPVMRRYEDEGVLQDVYVVVDRYSPGLGL